MTTMLRKMLLAAPLLPLLAGCAETAFQDTLGLGKSAPDETKVRTVQPLSVPPDLDLRPPVAGRAGDADATAATGAPASSALSAPPADGAPADAGAQRTAARQQPSLTPQAPASTESSFYDVYRKYGISLQHPDGTRKKISELNRELAEKIKEEKRRKNPRYGSIFNIDSLWKD